MLSPAIIDLSWPDLVAYGTEFFFYITEYVREFQWYVTR